MGGENVRQWIWRTLSRNFAVDGSSDSIQTNWQIGGGKMR